MPLFDRRGVPLSTARPDSAERYERALALMLAYRGSALGAIEEALGHDPDFVSGHCLRAALLVLAGDRRNDRALEAAIAAVTARRGSAVERERRHAAAAQAWLTGNPRAAARRDADLAIDYPRDVVALQLAHAFDFHLGRRRMLRDRIAQVLPHWRADLPGYGSVLAMYAFGLEENGAFAAAQTMARHALQAAPGNPAAIHVVAHVMEMQGRSDEGIAWLEATEAAWAEGTAFQVHNAWHLALFHLDRGDADAALAIYDERIAVPGASTNALIDASALLWRLSIAGRRLHDRWSALADRWEAEALEQQRVFAHAHAMMAFAAAGREDSVQRVFAALARRDALRSNSREDLRLAQPVCEALRAFGRGEYARAVERLTRVRGLAHHCGGSIAQCDLIHLTLVEAALRGQRPRLARALAAERAARKPESLLNRWLAVRATRALAVR